MSDSTIDPGPRPGSPLPGERHVSEVAGGRPGIGRKAGVGAILALGALACGAIVLTSGKPGLKPDTGPPLAVRPTVRYEPPPPLPPQPVALPVPAQAPPPLPDAAPAMAPPAKPAPRPRLLVYSSSDTPSSASGAQAGAGAEVAIGAGATTLPAGYADPYPPGRPGGAGAADPGGYANDALSSRLKPTQVTGVAATVLPNQPYLLTTGTVVPCVLQTAMDSTLPGFVTCVIPQDVLGKTGLTLLDRGTKVVGEFRGGVRQGVERMFVVWTRAETPQGVVVALDSPASDALGRAGLDGEVDRRFWQRFGAALLLSTVDGAIRAGVNAAGDGDDTTINTGQAQGVIAETLRGSINIPPVVRKNQGELVSIFVARDLDFSTVYRLQPAAPRQVRQVAPGGAR